MLKWFSGEEGEPGSAAQGSPRGAAEGGEVALAEMAERLSQTEQLVAQLKELIREKDATLRTQNEQFKVEKEACEAKLSKLRLQNKAKVTSLSAQLEELKNQQGGRDMPTHHKKGVSEGGEQASRGKIVLLKKKVEEMEQQLAQKEEELEKQRKEVASNRQRGEEMDAMLMEKDRKMAEKDAYIIHLQTAMTGDHPVIPALQQKAAEESGAVQQDSGAVQELQLLVQSLTTKVGEAEERYSLLQEQTESLRNLLATEKEQYSQKETMYKQNIQTFKDIILQKDNQLTQVSQMHEQELFRLAAKSDASADLEQLLKALKQKLHEKEEVLLGKAQVIDVLQGEVDGRDEQIKELTERLRRLQVERESLESRMEAEKHVMRAQVRDLMEKHQVEVQRMIEQHQAQMAQTQQDLLRQLEELRKTSSLQKSNLEASDSRISPTDSASVERLAELEAQAKHKTDEASKSEAKFLKMKAWSKSRIRQLEEELKKSQSGVAPPDLMALRNRVISLEEEREEYLWKLDQYEELRMKNEMLEAKLVVYEEQQRTLQADLEQFTKRAASQASESGSADDTQSQVLEWQEMVTEAVTARDRAREEKAAMVLRINHMEEEREALATRQRELEEELAQARVLEQHRAKKLAAPAQRSLQEDFDFDGQPPFMDRCSTSESTTPMEGENMGDGLRSVVEELELERNQLQEQILSLEERCHDLEDRLQLQARIEALQNESEKLQNQLASVRLQQTKDAEEHRLLVNSLSDQLKGLSDTQESLESSLIEKENTLAETSEKLELINNLRQSLSEKQIHYKEVSDKLLQTEHTLDTISKKYSSSEKQCSELKIEVGNLTQKLSVLKEKTQKQEVTIDVLQAELDQTNEELDKLNTAHLEERAQLIHELQSCERDIDSLKDLLSEKEKEISTLSGNMTEYVEQVTVLKQEIKLKEETLCDVENALSKAEREAMIIRDSQNSDQQVLNSKITELDGKLKGTEMELFKAKQERETKAAEVEHLIRQAKQDKKTIQDLRSEIQKHTASHRNHLSECETQITSLKEQLALSTRKLQEETEGRTMQLKEKNAVKEKLQQQLHEKEQAYETEVKSFKEEQNKLLMQVQKYGDDVQSLSVQLQVKVQGEERIQKAMQEKLETIARLENHLKEAEDERNKISFDLQARDLENEKLYSEVHSKEDILQSMNIEKLQMQEKLNGLTEELKVKNQMVRQLNDELTSALKLNSSLEKKVDCLTEANEKLQMEVAESVKSISELTLYKESLQAKISMFEAQHLQSTKHIEGLQQDNEKLAARTTELTTVLEQSTNSNSEQLLAKTNECSHLKQLLQAMEEKVKQLQEERQTLISTVNQLQDDLADKEKAVTDLQAQIMVQHSQQMQLQETLSLLREQESDLKSGLLANDAILKLKEEECCSLHNEVVHQKGFVSKLQADAESLKEECEQLHHQINERKRALNDLTQQIQKHEEELSVANKTVMTLRDQLGLAEDTARKLESEKSGTIMSLESYEKENASMKQQLDQGQSELASLHARIQEVSNENQRLCAACHSRETELAEKTQIVLDFGVQLKVAQEENSTFNLKISSLTEDNQRLQEDLEQNMKSVSELTAEKGLLEFQISENHKIIGLLKEKEQIAVAADALKKVLEENELLKSADLLEKTRKCEVLSQEVDALKAQVAQLNSFLNEKELTVLERSTQLQAQQNQLVQLQDTIFMLQEQGSVLKSGLMEKDIIVQQKEEEVRVFQKEVVLQKDLVTHLQDEVESLKRECLEAKVQLEDKGKTLQDVINELQKHKDELKKRSESVISLSSQLGAMNENAAEIETEISNLKTTVQNLSAEKDQSVIEVNECKDKIIVLNEQNAKFKSELQKTVAELSKALAEVTDLKSTVSKKDVQVSDLTQEVKHVFLDKERLNLIIQEKEHSLKQQEDFIQKVNSKNAEQELQLKEKDDDNTKLKMHISKLEESIIKLRGQVDGLVSESSVLKDHLEKKEQLSLECQSSTAVIENLNSNLQAKEAECESLKEQISHLEESVAKLSSTIHVQISEMETLKKSMEGKEAVLLDQWKSLQDRSRRADEALLFKTQYMESTELVAQLQCQIQLLSTECDNLRRPTEETQSAFNNLKEKYAVELEELQDVRRQLSQRTEEVSLHRKLLDDTNSEVEIAKTTIETLRNELSVSHSKLDKAQELNSSISKEKDEALSSHQTSVSLLTVEIERLKSQHIQVVAQMNALTENLEQREMALHAINKQYTAQAKHSAQLLSEVQQLKSRNKRVSQENAGSLAELQKQLSLVSSENTHLQEDLKRVLSEKNELEQRHHDILTTQGELHVQMEQQSSSMTQRMEKMVLEKESLQTEVSVKDGEISQLKSSILKLEQTLQDSEKEWLLVLDSKKQEKNLLAEQLQSVETEINSKDFKMNVLKQDLDSLQAKLAEAASAIRLGSEQLVAKEFEASAFRSQLENVLASVQEKENENRLLQETLNALEQDICELVARTMDNSQDRSVLLPSLNDEKPSLQTFIKLLVESHQSEVESLKKEAAKTSAQLQKAENTLDAGETSHQENCQKIDLLQEMVECLQAELHAESEKVKEAGLKLSLLHSELKSKDDQINFMNIQASQQKELLAGLTQQLKEKKALIAQVLESASNERMKFEEKNRVLMAEFESMDQENKAATKKIEEISQQLDENTTRCQREIETKNLETDDLIKEVDHLKSKVASESKEKDALKKKLQATLIVRKQLLGKIEEYEKQKAEFLQSETEVSALKDKLQEVTFQSEATASMNKEKILDLEKKMGEKEEHILKHKREIEHLVEKIQTEKEILQSALNEKEALLSETLRTLDAKNSLIEHLQCSFSEKADAFEQDRKCMMQKLEELQNEIKKSQDDLKDKDSSSVAVENELAQLKLDQAMLQKKTRAALLARKETMKKAQEQENKLMKELAELKDDYNALLEQHCQQPNQLNNVQLNFDKKVQELDNLQKMFLCNLDELDTLRQLVSEKDKTLQDLKVSLAEKESQCRTLPSLEADLVSVKSKHEQLFVEMAGKDESASIMQLKVEALNEKIAMIESDLAQARADVKDKTEELDKYQETVKAAELKVQQEKLALTDEILVLKNQLSICQSESEEQKQALNTHICSHEQKYQLLMEEKKALLEQSHQLKADLQAAVDSVSQKSLEVLTVQKTLSEKLQRLSEERDVLTEDLEKAKLLCTEKQSNIESMKQEKENAFRVTGELKDKVTALSSHLKEAKKQNEQLHKKMSEMCFEQGEDKKYAETYEVKLKERDGALLLSQAQLLEKEGIITALELQLQQQIKMHQLAIDKVRTEVDELQKSRQDDTKSNDQDDQGKVAVLTRKLQAALISRKELFKENATLKEQVQKLSTQHEAKEAQRLSVEASLSELKEQKLDLESHVFSLNKEKEMLSTEVDRILNENRSLSAACESLKLTIENITQQKQAFSCQLESLKDSQAEELSKWKSKHSELKQEYESLLQGYENVSSEMDKMRQLLEGAKRERQDALKKVHRHETEAEILGNQTRELEAEKKRMEAKLEALEDVNHTMRRELSEVDGSHETVIRDLTVKNQQLEAQVSDLKELSDKLTEVQAENINLTKKLEEASSYEQMHIKSKSCVHDMQLKLNEALTLNNSLTAQFEAQKTELGAQFETNNLLQREKQSLSERIEMIQNDHELQLGFKECVIKDLQDIINRNSQETISLNEKVRILEDDKTLLQEELENVQEISDKVKNENEYLETVILKNSERIDELTESVTVLQNQNAQLSSQLSASDGKINQVLQEKETEQLRLVREFEDKLKTFQRGNEGSKNVKKGLQELLKEKHHEIKQLQQNSINYQEVIWDLENNLKSSKSTCKHLEQELKKHSEKILILEERSEQVEAELSKHKSLLLEANKTVVRVQFERDQVAQEMLQQNNMSNCEVVERTKSPQKTNEKQMESQILLQQQLEDLQKLKEQESQKVTELRQHIDAQDVQINMLKRAAETNEAKLSALASTPHGADSLRHWNELYQKSLHEKDSQLLEQGFVIKRFLEDMRVKEKEVNELRMTKSRLERTLNEYSVAAAAQQRQAFVTSASNAELTEIVELMTVQVKELSSRVERLEQEKSALNRQLADKEDVMSDVQLNVQHMEKMNADLDAQLVLLQSQNDKVQADLEKQEGISLQLKTLLQSKDAEISSLLSCKDGQMSGFIEQLQANYRTQVAVYEDRLSSLRYQKERVDKEFRGLETKVRNLQTKVDKSIQERKQMEARMESFRNSVVSLQSEQEQLMSENRILNAKNQLMLKGKDDSADREVGTAKGFKHEIRKLLHQMDDLNSENAMLRAQLVRYREDLNQVLSLKDNQLKGLLKKQQDMIKNLENQKTAAEKQHRECRLDLQKEEETNHIFKTEKYKLQAQVQKLQSEIEAQKKENATTNEGRVIADLQQAVEAKAAQCNDLQQKLLSQKFLTGEQKGKIKQLENEMDKKLTDAEDKFNSELDSFEQEVELMRNQREMADQRLAELTNNLLQTEQQLLEAKAQNKDTRAQNESLCKAMAALQNNRDQLIEDFKVLQSRYDEELRETQSSLTKVECSLQDATSNLAMFAKEKDILVQKMKALESNEAHSELSKLLDEVSKALSQKERELKQVALENDTYKRQLSAFSRSMASLQNDRDRLVDELAETKSVVESRQQTSSGSVTSVIVEKSKDDFTSIFRNEKEGLNNRQMSDYLQKMEQRMQTSTPQHEKEVGRSQEEITDFRSDVCRQQNEFQTAKEPTDKKEAQLLKQEAGALAGRGRSEEVVSRLETERIQLHRDLQRCMYEIQQRDQYFQQLNVKLQQVMEEKGVVAAQLRAVSETLRNTQNHCHWLENQGQAQGALFAEDAPGAPQERSSLSITMETDEASQLRERLVEVEQSLSEERSRREMAEEALRLLEDRTKSVGTSVSRDRPNDFSIHLEAEEEWEALSLNPNQPLISRKVKGGMAACRQWLRGRSLYFSKLLMSRGRARYLFLAYLLTLHVLVFMCLSGAL